MLRISRDYPTCRRYAVAVHASSIKISSKNIGVDEARLLRISRDRHENKKLLNLPVSGERIKEK